MIIFGWGRQKTKDYGPTFKRVCDHCKNEDYWNLTSVSTWFTLFFIPIFPYSIKRFLTCPVCTYGFELESVQFESVKPIAESNKLLIEGKITEHEYRARLSQPSGDNNETEVSKQLKTGKNTTKIKQLKTSYCEDCGNKLEKNSKFCSKCGVKTS